MSYLARLKQDLSASEPNLVDNVHKVEPEDRPEALEPFEGFAGAGTGDISRRTSANLHVFSAEKKENVLIQFYRDPQKDRVEGHSLVFDRKTRLGDKPAKPAKVFADTPDDWRRRFYSLTSVEAPCPGFRLTMDWRQTFNAAHAFLETHAEAAHALGWTALDLFAVHRAVGGNRVDCCGALMLSADKRVATVQAGIIQFVRLKDGQPCGRFFRTPANPEMILVWEFNL